MSDKYLLELVDIAEEFCDRVDRGEVRSKYTYRKFVDALKRIPGNKYSVTPKEVQDDYH